MTIDQDPRWRAVGTWGSVAFCLAFWILLVTGFVQAASEPGGAAQQQINLSS